MDLWCLQMTLSCVVRRWKTTWSKLEIWEKRGMKVGRSKTDVSKQKGRRWEGKSAKSRGDEGAGA